MKTLGLILLAYVAGQFLLAYLVPIVAADGYEDAEGFHFGSENAELSDRRPKQPTI